MSRKKLAPKVQKELDDIIDRIEEHQKNKAVLLSDVYKLYPKFTDETYTVAGLVERITGKDRISGDI